MAGESVPMAVDTKGKRKVEEIEDQEEIADGMGGESVPMAVDRKGKRKVEEIEDQEELAKRMAGELVQMAVDWKGKGKGEETEDKEELADGVLIRLAVEHQDKIFSPAQEKYIAQVSRKFTPEVFKEFLELVEQHCTEPIARPFVIPRLEKLFRSPMHYELMLGFDAFLPEGGKLADLATLDEKARTIKSNIEGGLDPESILAFRDLVLELNASKISVDDAYKRARVIFRGNSYLLSVFRTLLPVPTYLRRTGEQDPIQPNPISPNRKQPLRSKPPTENSKKVDTQIMGTRFRFPCDVCWNQNYKMDDITEGDSEEYKAMCAAKLAKDRERLRLLGLYTPDPESPPPPPQ